VGQIQSDELRDTYCRNDIFAEIREGRVVQDSRKCKRILIDIPKYGKLLDIILIYSKLQPVPRWLQRYIV
jgi:hypothetical protein